MVETGAECVGMIGRFHGDSASTEHSPYRGSMDTVEELQDAACKLGFGLSGMSHATSPSPSRPQAITLLSTPERGSLNRTPLGGDAALSQGLAAGAGAGGTLIGREHAEQENRHIRDDFVYESPPANTGAIDGLGVPSQRWSGSGRVWEPEAAITQPLKATRVSTDDLEEEYYHERGVSGSMSELCSVNRAAVFTPPIVPASRMEAAHGMNGRASKFSVEAGSMSQLTESLGEEELDLMYDPILNFYYDPKTNKYYELL